MAKFWEEKEKAPEKVEPEVEPEVQPGPPKPKPVKIDKAQKEAEAIMKLGMNNIMYRKARNKFLGMADAAGTGALDFKVEMVRLIKEQLEGKWS